MKNSLSISFLMTILLIPVASHAIDQSSPPDSLVVDTTGNVGIGTNSPSSDLTVKRDGASVLVEDTNSTNAIRTMLQMSNYGPGGFSLIDRERARTWEFRSDNQGAFTINNTSNVPNAEFIVFPTGNIKAKGTSTATSHISSSSVTVKKNFSEVDPQSVMEKLKSLEVTEWQYMNPEAVGRHIGPMAEDFYKLFELGPDNKHIAATDMASIALIAAKKLQKENTALKQRLDSLEKLVTNLASGQGLLSEKGDKVVLK